MENYGWALKSRQQREWGRNRHMVIKEKAKLPQSERNPLHDGICIIFQLSPKRIYTKIYQNNKFEE